MEKAKEQSPASSQKLSGNLSISTAISSQFKALKQSNMANLKKLLQNDKKGNGKLEQMPQPQRSSTPTAQEIQLTNRLPLGEKDEFIFEPHSSESEKEDATFHSIDEEIKLEVIEKDEQTFFDDKLELQQHRKKMSVVEEEKDQEDADESMDGPM